MIEINLFNDENCCDRCNWNQYFQPFQLKIVTGYLSLNRLISIASMTFLHWNGWFQSFQIQCTASLKRLNSTVAVVINICNELVWAIKWVIFLNPFNVLSTFFLHENLCAGPFMFTRHFDSWEYEFLVMSNYVHCQLSNRFIVIF